MSIEAMKQALEALEEIMGWQTLAPAQAQRNAHISITSLRQAIQEEALRNVARLGQEIEQEPVAWMTPTKDLFSTYKTAKTGCGFGVEPIPLYTHPPKKQEPIREMLIDAATLAVASERKGKYQGASWVADAIFENTHPQPKREWVGLTDDELKPLCDENHIIYGAYTVDFIQAIEAKLKEKNT